jgi:protein-disulfide isomerase
MDQSSNEIKEADNDNPTSEEPNSMETDEAEIDGPASEESDSEDERENRVWQWILIGLLIGGIGGFLLGRQSGLAQETTSASAAVDSQIDVSATTLPAAEGSEFETSGIALGPTPVGIQPEMVRTLGDPDAPVTVVEFSDYQCPFCLRHFQQTIPLLKENYIDTGRVYYIFKDFPIEGLHPLAYRLHEAALCVVDSDDTDGYWQAHDLFFTDAESFQVDTLEAMDAAILAEFTAVGLPDVSECLQSNKYAEAVQADLNEARSLGVNSTPSFFINGFPITGAQPYSVFESAIGLAERGMLQEAFAESAQAQAQAQAQAEAEATAQAAPKDVPLSDEPAKGSADASITIVEYSDYQCPFCLRHFQQTIPQMQQYIDAGQVRYVFKDYPIHSIHPQAQKAHEAARCAREIGGDDLYWTMHDILFSRQDEWSQMPVPGHEAILKTYAVEAGLPQDEFDECLDSGRYYDAVNAEVAEGLQLGVNGTPTFFVNGQPLVGAQPFPIFQQVFEQLLENS